jgi:hypothetical protein
MNQRSKKRRGIRKFLTPSSVILALALLFLLTISVAIGAKQGPTEPYIGTVPSDVISYNSLLEMPAKNGDIFANGIHTFLIKYPLFLLENLFGLSTTTLTIFAILMMIATNGGLAYLIWRFSRRNKIATAGLIFALGLINMLTNVDYFFLAQSWLTVRNIEIPLIFAMLAWAANGAKLKRWQKITAVLLLALNFASDRLVMYYAVAGLILYLLLALWRSRKNWLRENIDLIKLSAWAMIASFAIELILNGMGIVKFAYTYPSTVSIVKSFAQFCATLGDGVKSLFYVFGADIWNSQFWQAPLYILSAGFVLVAIGAAVKLCANFVKNVPNEKDDDALFNQNSALFLATFAAASFGCYIFLNHTQGLGVDARFLIFIPAAGLLVLARNLRNFRPKITKPKIAIGATIVAILVVGAGFTMNQLYQKHDANLASAQHTYRTAAEILKKEKITALAGGYPYLHSIKWVYEQNYGEKLDLAVMLDNHCNVADSKSARKSWFTDGAPDGHERVALFSMLLPCSEQQIVEFYGQPTTKYLITLSDNQLQAVVYIFDYDIRARFDMSQFRD